MSDEQTSKAIAPNVYQRFCEEVDALVIGANDPVVSVVGELTRAVKRAQMVVDGELEPVVVRKRAADQYVSEVMAGLVAAREAKDAAHGPSAESSYGTGRP